MSTSSPSNKDLFSKRRKLNPAEDTLKITFPPPSQQVNNLTGALPVTPLDQTIPIPQRPPPIIRPSSTLPPKFRLQQLSQGLTIHSVPGSAPNCSSDQSSPSFFSTDGRPVGTQAREKMAVLTGSEPTPCYTKSFPPVGKGALNSPIGWKGAD